MMRTFPLILVLNLVLVHFAFGGGYDPASFSSHASIPTEAKPWFEALAKSDLNHDELVELAKVPEAEPAMIELIQRILADPVGNPEFLHPVLRATALRTDLSEAHQAWLRNLLRSKLGRTKSYMEVIFKMYAPEILTKYPGPENEQLMIDYLKDKDVVDVVPGAPDLGHSKTAMRVLGISLGTARAIEPLREYAKQFKPAPGAHVYAYEDVLEAIAAIKEREKQKASAPGAQTKASVNQASGKSSAAPEHLTAEQPPADTFTVAAIVLLAALALGGLTLHQWRRARRK